MLVHSILDVYFLFYFSHLFLLVINFKVIQNLLVQFVQDVQNETPHVDYKFIWGAVLLINFLKVKRSHFFLLWLLLFQHLILNFFLIILRNYCTKNNKIL